MFFTLEDLLHLPHLFGVTLAFSGALVIFAANIVGIIKFKQWRWRLLFGVATILNLFAFIMAGHVAFLTLIPDLPWLVRQMWLVATQAPVTP
ncbi:hypothetical protein [Kordiimonas sp.]|uniref:hypothetical protein n=1 Tax=Kordiimonas sp. TaxID=1970157 RepID=UPI003A93239F